MKYIKHPIPEEITDKGGASVQLVQKQTIPLDGAIDAAIEAHYAIGQKEFIHNGVIGTMKSMAAGVRRDGRPRSIEGFLTVYPVFKGPIDLEKGYDPEVNKVQIKARLLDELTLDISNWTFEDVTPGKKAFKLNSVKAGPVLNVVEIGSVLAMNGENLPSTEAGEELRVHWEVEGTDKSGDIPAAKLSSDVGRADIAADALDELKDAEYDGKTIVFTARGNFSSAKISAKLKYAGPVPLAESEDGLIKIWKVEPVEGAKITLSKNTKVTGETLGYDDETGAGIMGVHLVFPGDVTYDCGMDTIPLESTELVLTPGEIPEGLEPGDYEVEMQFERVRDFESIEMITVHNLPVTVEAS